MWLFCDSSMQAGVERMMHNNSGAAPACGWVDCRF